MPQSVLPKPASISPICPLVPALFSGHGNATSPAFSVQLLPGYQPQGIAPAVVCPFGHLLSTPWSYSLDNEACPQTLACQGTL